MRRVVSSAWPPRRSASSFCPRWATVRATFTASPGSSEQVMSQRAFHSGLDPQRERRLRLSGITFNKPRGRDSATQLFEQKIKLVEMYTVSDVTKDMRPGVAVVELTDMPTVEGVQIALPMPSPQHYGESLPEPLALTANSTSTATSTSAAADYNSTSNVPSRAPPMPYSTLSAGARRNLRRPADSWAELFNPSDRGGPVLVRVVEPKINEKQFRREEAQVELITAYRNILCDCAEWCLAPPPRVGATGPDPKEYKGRTPIHTLRVPGLALFSAGDQIAHDIAKLNQQALIKGFHRCPNPIKDWYAMQPHFSVQLYVPVALWPKFVKAFNEEPWPHPESIWDPGRLTLYPGLPVPEGLLKYDGWTGKRDEILSAGTHPERQLNLSAPVGEYDAIKGASMHGTQKPPPGAVGSHGVNTAATEESVLGVGPAPLSAGPKADHAPPMGGAPTLRRSSGAGTGVSA